MRWMFDGCVYCVCRDASMQKNYGLARTVVQCVRAETYVSAFFRYNTLRRNPNVTRPTSRVIRAWTGRRRRHNFYRRGIDVGALPLALGPRARSARVASRARSRGSAPTRCRARAKRREAGLGCPAAALPRILDTACLARHMIESSLTHSLETARSSMMHVEFDRWVFGGSGPMSTSSSGALATPLYVLCQRVVYRSGVHIHRYSQLATTLPACS